jgi:hypothetical protein
MKQLPGLSFAEYAKQRGCSRNAVSKAVKAGRLRDAVQRVDGVPRIIDVELADREWAANTDPTRQLSTTTAARAAAARHRRRHLVVEHVVPVAPDHMEVSIEDGYLVVCVDSPLGDDDLSDYTFPLDVAGARWLASELAKWADKSVQRALDRSEAERLLADGQPSEARAES